MFTVEDIQKHQQELESHLNELTSEMEAKKQKINAIHGAITTCKFFTKLMEVPVTEEANPVTGTNPVTVDHNQTEIPFGD